MGDGCRFQPFIFQGVCLFFLDVNRVFFVLPRLQQKSRVVFFSSFSDRRTKKITKKHPGLSEESELERGNGLGQSAGRQSQLLWQKKFFLDFPAGKTDDSSIYMFPWEEVAEIYMVEWS